MRGAARVGDTRVRCACGGVEVVVCAGAVSVGGGVPAEGCARCAAARRLCRCPCVRASRGGRRGRTRPGASRRAGRSGAFARRHPRWADPAAERRGDARVGVVRGGGGARASRSHRVVACVCRGSGLACMRALAPCCIVRPYPCARCSKLKSRSYSRTGMPRCCSARAAAAPPIPPPAMATVPRCAMSVGSGARRGSGIAPATNPLLEHSTHGRRILACGTPGRFLFLLGRT